MAFRTQDWFGGCSRTAWLAFAMVMVASVGCGGSGDTSHLSGKVTLGGQPFPSDAEGSITFASESNASENEPLVVPINPSDGQYDATGVPQGNVRAYFSIHRKGPVRRSERTGEDYQEKINLVPGAYSTGIGLQVTGDNPNQDFEL